MTDFFSGVFLCSTLFLTIILTLLIVIRVRLRKKLKRFDKAAILIVLMLCLFWVGDRFYVGQFCFPWECSNGEPQPETFLLTNSELPNGWSENSTYSLSLEKAEKSYVRRRFSSNELTPFVDMSQGVIQYTSTRAALFHYYQLSEYFPSYKVKDEGPNLKDTVTINYPIHASKYKLECSIGSNKICYFIGQYENFIITLEAPYKVGETNPTDLFSSYVFIVDEKANKAVVR